MKKKLFAFQFREAILPLLIIWMAISALYYVENLFSPSSYIGYEEGTAHKTIKYIVCVFFTITLSLLARTYSLLLATGIFILLNLTLVIYNGMIGISTLSMLIAATMISFMHVPKIWPEKLPVIGRTIVYVGAVVGAFSVIELTVLATIFESSWTSTGSIRSISTLLNPNNLGLYAGACLILLPYLGLRLLPLAVVSPLIFFAFIASGSRTAWVSLLIVLIYQLLRSRSFRRKISRLISGHLIRAFALFSSIAMIFLIYKTFNAPPDIDITNRGTDLYTASLRWDNIIRFINAIDISIIFPDLADKRTDFIQDNFYLVVLNSFGIVGILIILPFLLTHFKPRRSINPNFVPWKIMFAYYMISGLSGSHLNSFPNNQLFFLSLGTVYVYSTRITQNKNRPYQMDLQINNVQPSLKG